MEAKDLDEGVNAIVRYELMSGDANHFSIDPVSGDLFAFGDLKAGDEFLLSVKVSF